MEEIVNNSEDSEFRDNSSQIYDSDMSPENINKPPKMKEMTALSMKRQKTIFTNAHRQKQRDREALFSFYWEASGKSQNSENLEFFKLFITLKTAELISRETN